jgi:hypothetical protein
MYLPLEAKVAGVALRIGEPRDEVADRVGSPRVEAAKLTALHLPVLFHDAIVAKGDASLRIDEFP